MSLGPGTRVLILLLLVGILLAEFEGHYQISWKKSFDKPRQSIKKQRHHFATKVRIVKAMGFAVVMYGCESWVIKKAEC